MARAEKSRNSELYPVKLMVSGDIGKGVVRSTTDDSTILDGYGAVRIQIEIASPDYPIEDVKTAIKEICQRVFGYYC